MFVLIVYSPYYLPVVLAIWLLIIGVLVITGKRRAAKYMLIVLAVLAGIFVLLGGALGFAL